MAICNSNFQNSSKHQTAFDSTKLSGTDGIPIFVLKKKNHISSSQSNLFSICLIVSSFLGSWKVWCAVPCLVNGERLDAKIVCH